MESLSVIVDFNDSRDRPCGLVESVKGGVAEPGARILIHDGGEDAAWGSVDRIENGLVYVTVDWSTFGSVGVPS